MGTPGTCTVPHSREVFLTLESHKYSVCAWKMEEIPVHIQEVIGYSATITISDQLCYISMEVDTSV